MSKCFVVKQFGIISRILTNILLGKMLSRKDVGFNIASTLQWVLSGYPKSLIIRDATPQWKFLSFDQSSSPSVSMK